MTAVNLEPLRLGVQVLEALGNSIPDMNEATRQSFDRVLADMRFTIDLVADALATRDWVANAHINKALTRITETKS